MCQKKNNTSSTTEKLEDVFVRLNQAKLRNKDIDSIGVHIAKIKLGAIYIKEIKITLAALAIIGFTIFFVIKL